MLHLRKAYSGGRPQILQRRVNNSQFLLPFNTTRNDAFAKIRNRKTEEKQASTSHQADRTNRQRLHRNYSCTRFLHTSKTSNTMCHARISLKQTYAKTHLSSNGFKFYDMWYTQHIHTKASMCNIAYALVWQCRADCNDNSSPASWNVVPR